MRTVSQDKVYIREIVNELVNSMSDDECGSLIKQMDSETLHEVVKITIFKMVYG